MDVNSSFPNCLTNNCLETVDLVEFFIIDTGGRCRLHIGPEDEVELPWFHVKNPTERKLNFLAIDQCLFFEADGKRCDCAVFDESVFRFIELKKASKTRTRSKKRDHAIEQLKATISLFWSALTLNDFTLEAYLCVGHKRAVPRISATSQNHRKDFYDNYYGTHLYDCSQIIIS